MGLNYYNNIIGWAVTLDFFTEHFGVTLGVAPKYIDANCFSQKLRQFKLDF